MAEVFANPLVDLAEYTDMKQDLDQGKGPVQISGVTDSQKVHVMHELSKDNPWRLVVTYDDTARRRSSMISAILSRIPGCIRQGIFCFTARISTEIF